MTPWPFLPEDTQQSAGFIMTVDNEMVYCITDIGMHDFQVQVYNGTPYLTYWSGTNARVGHGYGKVVFQDGNLSNFSINPALELTPNPSSLTSETVEGMVDIHEAQVTDRDTLLVTAYNNTPWDLSGLGGPQDGWMIDSLFYEIDIKTLEVMFQWIATDHLEQIPLSTSRNPVIGDPDESNGTMALPWDWIHINSVELVGENYLISCRHTWSIYMISGQDGSVLWTFDGEVCL